MKTENKTCCFFGHRKISERDTLKITLYDTIENLIIYNNVRTFLFGSKSEFNELCKEIVNKLKLKYPYINRVYIRAEYAQINDDYEKYLLTHYEDTFFPKRAINSGKAVYLERNYEMIDNSDICIIYYNENYLPPKRKKSKKEFLDYQPKSGTHLSYQYAMKKNKTIINMLNF